MPDPVGGSAHADFTTGCRKKCVTIGDVQIWLTMQQLWKFPQKNEIE